MSLHRVLLWALLCAMSAGVDGVAHAAPQALLQAAPAATGASLAEAQARVDDALRARKERLTAWQRARDQRDSAALQIEERKRAGASATELAQPLRDALLLDEAATRARSALLAADAVVGERGAQVLRLYDAVLLARKRSLEALPAHDPQRAAAVRTFQALAAQRDAVQRALLPVLANPPAGDALAVRSDVDLSVGPSDDVEALLEKADLARDLEERLLRQAARVHARVRELADRQAVAEDVSRTLGSGQLFDEEDRQLRVVRSDLPSAQARSPLPAAKGGSRSTDANSPQQAPAGDFTDGVGVEGVGSQPESQPGLSGVPPPAVAPAAPAAPAPVVFGVTAQGIRRDDTAMGSRATVDGLLSASNASVEELSALEAALAKEAQRLRVQAAKLKAEAAARAHD